MAAFLNTRKYRLGYEVKRPKTWLILPYPIFHDNYESTQHNLLISTISASMINREPHPEGGSLSTDRKQPGSAVLASSPSQQLEPVL